MDPAALAQSSPEEQAIFLAALLEGPALEPPLGASSNFDHPGGSHAIGYSVVLLGSIVAALAVLLRLWSRALLKTFRIEDALLISALGLFAGHSYVLYELAIFPGFEVHQWNIQLQNLFPILYHVHLGSIFYGLVIMLLKVAILLDWLKIFVPRGQRNAVFWISHVMICANILFYGVGTLVEIFQCSPRTKIWNPLVEGKCPIDMRSHNMAAGIVNLISDLVILGLPQRVIWQLHMSRASKIGISLLFGIGIFACASAAVRLYYIYRLLHTSDQLYIVSIAGLWGVGEMTAGFLIIGFPSLPKVVKALPFSDSVVSLLRQITRPGSSGHAEGQAETRRGLPSWHKAAPLKKRRDQFEVSELSEYDLPDRDRVHMGDRR
ncbi:uncharacterized protein J4E92_010422 [Alternaria infectoria]|uniref:uncharacterized protein n=1 Tax=Alternaria infectoria TaxID=45303 RepID=UPI00221EAAE1|nr:uncharacterized protein J4E92_010422 [Alternaria infectoria]KAI4910494.1 hypothetical protein J4E92_010422 [Alternaria infectoria]